MGPTKFRGLGTGGAGSAGGAVNAPPTSPQNGSGGPGALNLGPLQGLSFAPALAEIGDVTTGRITLGMVNLTILGLIAFYYWTRSAQGGS